MTGSHNLVPKPSPLAALICLATAARLRPDWAAINLGAAAAECEVSPQRLSRLCSRAIDPFEATVGDLTRMGRPPADKATDKAEAERDLMTALLEVATSLLAQCRLTGPLFRCLVVGAWLRLHAQHSGLSRKRFCEALAVPERTLRHWLKTDQPPCEPKAQKTTPKPPKPPKRPPRRGRFDFSVVVPDTQIAADTTDLKAFGLTLKLVAAQDIGGRDQDLFESVIVDDHESAELVVKVLLEALQGTKADEVLTQALQALEQDQPSGATDSPEAEQDQAASAADLPVAEQDQPPGAADSPEAEQDQAAGAADLPAAEQDQPPGAADCPEAEQDQPQGAADCPEAEQDQTQGAADCPEAKQDQTPGAGTHSAQGKQAVCDQGTPYVAHKTRDALEQAGVDHAPQREGDPLGKATIERAFGTVKTIAKPLLDITNRLAESIDSLKNLELAKAATTVFLIALLRSYQSGARAARRAVEQRSGLDEEALYRAAKASRQRAHAEDQSARMLLAHIHNAYQIGGSVTDFIRTFRRFPLPVLRRAERAFATQAHRDDIRNRKAYFTKLVRDFADDYRSEQATKQQGAAALEQQQHNAQEYQRQLALWQKEPSLHLREALEALSVQWDPASQALLFGGAGLGIPWLQDALNRLVELNGPTTARDIATGIFDAFARQHADILGPEGIATIEALINKHLPPAAQPPGVSEAIDACVHQLGGHNLKNTGPPSRPDTSPPLRT